MFMRLSFVWHWEVTLVLVATNKLCINTCLWFHIKQKCMDLGVLLSLHIRFIYTSNVWFIYFNHSFLFDYDSSIFYPTLVWRHLIIFFYKNTALLLSHMWDQNFQKRKISIQKYIWIMCCVLPFLFVGSCSFSKSHVQYLQ